MTIKRQTKRRITHVQAFPIIAIIKEHCKQDGDYAIYAKGINDESIAKQFGVATQSVQHLRKDMKLFLAPAPLAKKANSEKLHKRIDELEQKNTELRKAVLEQQDSYKQLIDMMTKPD